jgi:hypothetical protein
MTIRMVCSGDGSRSGRPWTRQSTAAPATPFTLLEVTIKTGRTIRFVCASGG